MNKKIKLTTDNVLFTKGRGTGNLTRTVDNAIQLLMYSNFKYNVELAVYDENGVVLTGKDYGTHDILTSLLYNIKYRLKNEHMEMYKKYFKEENNIISIEI